MEIVFKNPYYLWTLLVIPLIILIHFVSLNYSRKRALKFANFIALARISQKTGVSSNFFVLFLRILVFVSIIFAIAGTSLWFTGNKLEADYVIAIDSSSSMLADDLKPNRLQIAKESAVEFIDGLNPLYSSASVISFSGTSFIQQTLTKDKRVLKDAISGINFSRIGGTDIGNAMITGANILLSSDKPKIMIIITDGRDNIGVGYERGIVYANEKNVIVYTVGIGSSEGFAESANDLKLGPLGIDEEQLREIAQTTGGNYYHVLSKEDFKNSYENILNTKEKKISLDLTFILLMVVLGLLVLEWILINTKYKIIP